MSGSPNPEAADSRTQAVAALSGPIPSSVADRVARDAGLLTTSSLVEESGVTSRQVEYWTTVGYIPVAVRSPGTGYANLYQPEAVRICQVLAAITLWGSPKGGFFSEQVRREIARIDGPWTFTAPNGVEITVRFPASDDLAN